MKEKPITITKFKLAMVVLLTSRALGSATAQQSGLDNKPANLAAGSTQGLASVSQPPTAKPAVPPAKPPVRVPKFQPMPSGPKQLHVMFLDTKLFTPDKWWGYEEADDDRPAEYSVEQEGKVSLGGRFEPNHGGQVTYHVTVFPTAAAAHEYFAKAEKSTKTMKSPTPISVKSLKKGDEAYTADNTRTAAGTPIAYARNTTVRFDKYLVVISSNANMRAFGPRPAHGERRWLCEPVYDAVLNAAMAKWANYKSLLPEKK